MNIDLLNEGLSACPIMRFSSDTDAYFVKLQNSIALLLKSQNDNASFKIQADTNRANQLTLEVVKSSESNTLIESAQYNFIYKLSQENLIELSSIIQTLVKSTGFAWLETNNKNLNLLICRYEHNYT